METNLILEDVQAHSEPSVSALASSRGKKFGLDPLISESSDGEVVFAEAAVLASARSREQARLFYEKGIQETRLVNAMRWREVDSQYSREEIANAEEIMYGRVDTLRKEDSFAKAIECELRRDNPDPFKLDNLENQLRSFRPFAEAVRQKITSATERELALAKFLERLKKLDRKAKGWKLKAQRQVACGIFGQPYEASKCGRSYFLRFRCRNRYCQKCGPHVHDELVGKYLRLGPLVKGFLAENPSYRLRILDITAIKRGDEMPSADAVRQFKADVKKLIERVNCRVAEKFGLPYSKQLTGYLYCLEFGFENNNLHCHGLLLSPFIEQEWLSEQWRQIRNDGSFRVLIAEADSFEAGLKHSLEYTGKYAAPTAGRAFELELAFAGCRRVDGLGWFFNRLPKEDEDGDLRCPCGDPECFLKPNREVGWQPILYFEERGIRDLDEVRERGSPFQKKAGASWVN